MFVNLEKTLASLVQKMERRFYGKYRAVVIDNADPELLGRLKLKIPSVLGEEVPSGWAMPCVPYAGDANQGMLFIPEVGAGVWVEFEEGDLESPIWSGMFWSKPDGETEVPKPNAEDGAEEGDVQDPITRKIIKTKKGHTIQFEDKDGEELITIVQIVDAENDKKNVVLLNASGITLTDVTENKIEMSDSAFTITAKVPFTLDASGQPVEIKGDTVDFTKA